MLPLPKLSVIFEPFGFSLHFSDRLKQRVAAREIRLWRALEVLAGSAFEVAMGVGLRYPESDADDFACLIGLLCRAQIDRNR